ncbi:MAG: hypothetical protein HUU35_15890, partial [Armatimonadetes bacterium]|nr:hypothetical protein [Armatimonadota bacterium]
MWYTANIMVPCFLVFYLPFRFTAPRHPACLAAGALLLLLIAKQTPLTARHLQQPTWPFQVLKYDAGVYLAEQPVEGPVASWNAGIIGYYFPSSVIKGMLTGIGLTIMLKQLPHAVGYDTDPEGSFAFAQAGGATTFSALGQMLGFIQPGALVVALVALAVLVLWEQPIVKRTKASLWIQGPLVAVALGILLNN